VTEEYSQAMLIDDDLLDEDASYEPLMAFPRRSADPTPFVERLRVKNLKGLLDLEVEFDKFNVLVGSNNCGKSTILQAIDLSFRLMQYHVEFQRSVLAKPRAGRRVVDEMLPVADPKDFWFERRIRVGNERIPVTIGVDLKGGLQFTFEIRRLWGGTNSRMIQFPQGLEEELMRDILARRPALIPASVGVVTREEYRTPARLELLSMTGHHTEVLRNYLVELSTQDPERFRRLQDDLRRLFDGTIQKVNFDSKSDQYISVRYREGGAEHDIFSAGGGFLQVLQILTYLLLQRPGIVLLDEPDAHLHSSMQMLVVDLLQGLSNTQGVQVILATHSKEIINYVDPSHILPISRDLRNARSLERHASVLPILQDLGAIDNADLAALVVSSRCVFVEGKDDRKLLAHFAARLGSTVFQGQSRVVVILAEGVDRPEKYVGLDVFEGFVGNPIRALIIRDRDGLPDGLVQEIRDYAAQRNRKVVCLSKTHLENYLLLPSVIWRVIREGLRHRAMKDERLPTEEEVTEIIEQAVDSLRDQTFDNIGIQIDKHNVAYHGKHLDHSRVNKEARRFLEAQWQTLSGKLSIVLGKEALKAIRRDVERNWGVSFSNHRLVEAMTDEEIPPEIKEIIATLEVL